MKNLLIIITLLMIVSCKKYDKCCKLTAYDKTNNEDIVTEACNTKMTEKESINFENSNAASINLGLITKYKDRYSNIIYTCK